MSIGLLATPLMVPLHPLLQQGDPGMPVHVHQDDLRAAASRCCSVIAAAPAMSQQTGARDLASWDG